MERAFKPTLGERIRAAGLAETAASALFHAGVLVMLATAARAVDEEDRADVHREHIALARAYLEAAGAGTDAASGAAGGRASEGERGARGKAGGGGPLASSAARDSLGARGGATSSARATTAARDARAAALDEARAFGMIGLLDARPMGDVDSPWARELGAPGVDWALTPADGIGDGIGGLALRGAGEGSGGFGAGIGIGALGTLGRAGGAGSGVARALGHCAFGVCGAHVTRAPVLRCGGPLDEAPGARAPCSPTVNGRLPPDIVQRVVRANFGRFRACYEAGLARDPSLEGRIAVKFVIDADGAVAVAAEADSDLSDDAVRACVTRAFGALSFPRPEGGIVTVVYPLVFSRE